MTPRRRPTVLVAMSGGVDSSVAAALLAQDGYDVIGVTLKLWCYDEREPARRACCSLEAIADARSIAVAHGFAHYVLDYSAEFKERVRDPFVAGYLAGRTPYPCAACNSDLKFGKLVAQARAIGAEFVATGHYVRRAWAARASGEPEPALIRAASYDKDQSYALWAVSRDVLPSLLFPLGCLDKAQVRVQAERLGLSRVADKEESQDLCFVGAGGYAAFVTQEAGESRALLPGPILDGEGREVGEHRGLVHYTVGQRRGLGRIPSGGRPQYVVALDVERSSVRVGPLESLYSKEAAIGPMNWLPADPPRSGERVEAQIRYRGNPAPARLWPRVGDASEGTVIDPSRGARLAFDEPQRAVTPGQSAVLYQGDRLLGGGEIAP